MSHYTYKIKRLSWDSSTPSSTIETETNAQLDILGNTANIINVSGSTQTFLGSERTVTTIFYQEITS
jgi:hypothetical protein